MNIELTSKEYRLLLDMVYIGNWILNSTRTDDRIEDYDLLQEKLFAKAPANGMRSLVESWQGHIFPSRAYEDGGIHEAIADYEDAVFYDILAEELARRDLGLENSDPEDATELTNRMDEYMAEFEKNGLSTINIDIRQSCEARIMHDKLTANDIKKMQEELDYRRLELMPEIIEEVKRTRAFGDLSENYEYKAAKQAQNKNRSRMRYLEGMIKTASVIDDNSKADEVGLFDKVEVYMPEDDETDIIQVVTTVRCDPRKGLISMDSPFGKQILGKKVGDKFTVHVSDTYSYEAEIRSITKTDDDGSAPLMSY